MMGWLNAISKNKSLHGFRLIFPAYLVSNPLAGTNSVARDAFTSRYYIAFEMKCLTYACYMKYN